MNVSTTIPTTVEIRREHLIGLVVAVAALAATITWLLVAVAFDSNAVRTQQDLAQPAAGTPTAIASTECPPHYQCVPGYRFPPGYRGMP